MHEHVMYRHEKYVSGVSEHRRCIAAGVAMPEKPVMAIHRSQGLSPYHPGTLHRKMKGYGVMRMRNRNTGINIRVTDKEKEIIAANASKCGLTISEYLRQLATKHDPKELPKKKIYDDMIKMDHQIDLMQRLTDSESGTKNKQNYEIVFRNMRRLQQHIWHLLLSNFDSGKGGAQDGND